MKRVVFVPAENEPELGNFSRQRLILAKRLVGERDGQIHGVLIRVFRMVKVANDAPHNRHDVLKNHPPRFHRARQRCRRRTHAQEANLQPTEFKYLRRR